MTSTAGHLVRFDYWLVASSDVDENDGGLSIEVT